MRHLRSRRRSNARPSSSSSRPGTLLPLIGAAALVLLGAAPLGAEEPATSATSEASGCPDLLRALEDADANDVLVADGNTLETIGFTPDARSDAADGQYIERETRTWRSGRRIEFRNTLVCTESGDLALAGAESLQDTEPSISFDEPLVWVPLPAEPGERWAWTGTFTTEIYGGRSKLPASADGRVVGESTFEHGGTTVSALEVELELRIGEGDERSVLRYRSWIELEPRYRVLKRILEDVTYDHTVVFHAEDLGTASQARSENVIILKAPVEKAE